MPLRRLVPLFLAALIPAAAFAGRPPGEPAPVPEGKVARKQVNAFAGLYEGKGVEVNVTTTGSAATVQIKEQKSKELISNLSGVGLARAGMFGAAISRSHNAGITVYHIESGKLSGVGAEAYGWNNVSLFAENLAGSSGLNGTYKITSATDIQGHAYGGTVTITKSAPDTYRLAWHLGSTEYWGTGCLVNGHLWTAWSKDKEASLMLLSPVSSEKPTEFNRLLLSNTGEPAVQLPPVTRVKSGAKEPEPEEETAPAKDAKKPAEPKPDKKSGNKKK